MGRIHTCVQVFLQHVELVVTFRNTPDRAEFEKSSDFECFVDSPCVTGLAGLPPGVCQCLPPAPCSLALVICFLDDCYSECKEMESRCLNLRFSHG